MDRHIYRDYINLWMNDVNEEMQPQQNESQTTLIQELGVTTVSYTHLRNQKDIIP